MIGRLTGPRGQLSSRWIASAFVIVYLIISGVVGVALLTAPKPESPDAIPVASTPPFSYTNTPPTTSMTRSTIPQRADDSGPHRGPATTTTTPPPTTPSAPAGYQRVSGPGGLATVIPQGWRSTRSSGPGAMQAADPKQAARYVKYGGSTAPKLPIETSHVQYENGFATRAADYRRINLSTASYAGHDAVEWEFEHREAGNYLHVRSLYWRTNGTEYFLLAAAPVNQWSEMKPIYDAMVAHATP